MPPQSRRGALVLALWAVLSVGLMSACATSTTAAVMPTVTETDGPDPVRGKALFAGAADIEGFVACVTCHTNDPAASSGVGPNLAGIARRAAERITGLAAPEYIERSIRIHDEYVVPGYTPGIAKGVVGRDFGEVLSDQEVDDLVAYLLTLTTPMVAEPAATDLARATTLPAPSAVRPTLTSAPTAVEPTALPASATPEPPPMATLTPAPSVAATTNPPPAAEATLPSLPLDPDLARLAPCVACHNQHPLQVQMPHPLNPACNTCHSGSPNQIGCPTCHSMHTIDNKHDTTPDLPCATCHT